MNTPKRAAAATTDVEPPKLPRAKRTMKRATGAVAPALPPPSPVPTAAEMAQLITQSKKAKEEPKRKVAEELVEREAIIFEPRMRNPENWVASPCSIDLFIVSCDDRWKFPNLDIGQIHGALVRRYQSSGYLINSHSARDGTWIFTIEIPRKAFE